MMLVTQGIKPPRASPMRKRKPMSCQPAVTKACGIKSSAETASERQ